MDDYEQLPSSPNDERKVIGCIMDAFDREAMSATLGEVFDILPDTDAFLESDCRPIYAAMLELWRQGRVIDLPCLHAELEHRGQLGEVGGEDGIIAIYERRSHYTNARYYAERVREAWARRRVIKTCKDLRGAAAKSTAFDAALADARQQLIEIQAAAGNNGRMPHEASAVVLQVLKQFEEGSMRLIPTGLNVIDQHMRGWPVSGLSLVAGRPSMGKSTLMLNCFRRNIAAGHKAAFFSFEMSAQDLVVHLVASMEGMYANDIAFGRVHPEERAGAFEHVAKLIGEDMGFIYGEGQGWNWGKVEGSIRALHERYGIEVAYLDYLGLLVNLQKGRTEDQTIGQLTRGLKMLAQELRIAIVAGSQVNRQCEQRDGKRPELADLRSSGNLEQDANNVLLVFRGHVYFPDDPHKHCRPDICLVRIAKQRMGPTSNWLRLHWEGAKHLITDWVEDGDD